MRVSSEIQNLGHGHYHSKHTSCFASFLSISDLIALCMPSWYTLLTSKRILTRSFIVSQVKLLTLSFANRTINSVDDVINKELTVIDLEVFVST